MSEFLRIREIISNHPAIEGVWGELTSYPSIPASVKTDLWRNLVSSWGIRDILTDEETDLLEKVSFNAD
jgi:hypothetical protein